MMITIIMKMMVIIIMIITTMVMMSLKMFIKRFSILAARSWSFSTMVSTLSANQRFVNVLPSLLVCNFLIYSM